MCHIRCDIQCLAFSYLLTQSFICEECVLYHLITLNCTFIYAGMFCAILIYERIVTMISSENCMRHRKSSFKLLSSFRVRKNCMILSFIIVFEPCCVISHCLNYENGFSSCQVTCTCDHMIHTKGIVSLLPNLFRLCKGFGSHHNVS